MGFFVLWAKETDPINRSNVAAKLILFILSFLFFSISICQALVAAQANPDGFIILGVFILLF